MEQRFITLADVADVLNVPMATVRSLVRNGELRGIQIGGKGTWRVESSELEDYIARMYELSAARLDTEELSEG